LRSPENSKAGAQAYEAFLRHKLAIGQTIGRRPAEENQTFAEFSKKWFGEYVGTNNKPSEQRTKKYILAASLVPFFGHLTIKEISNRDVERYKAKGLSEGISPKTMNNRLTILRKCLHTAYDWLGLPGKPPKIEWLKCAPPHTEYLTPEECQVLLRHSQGVIHEMALTALRTGMRQGELKGLQWDSIDWVNGIITVRHSRSDYTNALGSTKSNRERHIPLDIDLYEVLAARKRDKGYVFLDEKGRAFDHQRVSRALAAVCGNAGLRKVRWHMLRHTFATNLAMNGTPLNVVQALLGHSSITTTMRYAHVAPSALRTAIALANPRTAAMSQQPVGNRWQEQKVLTVGRDAKYQADMRVDWR
jgi:integrase